MFVRLLLALLLAAFATPVAAATAVCHAETAMQAEHGAHHRMPHRDERTTAHVCVGCAPLSDWLGERIAAPLPRAVVAPGSRVERLDLGRGIAPALPPPRTA